MEDAISLALSQELSSLKNRVPAHLHAIIAGYLQSGGKRLRPQLLMACYEAAGGNGAAAMPAAVAVEMFHNWTLIHDDVIDHDAFRRGNPTGHILGARLGRDAWKLPSAIADDYGVSAAILAGDALQARATEKLFELKGFAPEAVMSVIGKMTGELSQDLIAGEQLDVEMSHMDFEQVTEDVVYRMMKGKTGALLKYCAEAGAILGDNRPFEQSPIAQQLGRFTELCGLAFQLQDDILGIFGNEAKLGKPVGSDIREGKRTLMVCRAMANAPAQERDFLKMHLGQADLPAEDIAKIRDIMRQYALEAVQTEAENCIAQALEILDRALPDSPVKQSLAVFARKMTKRDF